TPSTRGPPTSAAGACPTCSSRATTRRWTGGGGSTSGEPRLARGKGLRMRNPIDHLTAGLPRGWRTTIDWLVTILIAILIVLAIKQWFVNPYRIPSSSMEPTLHCAGGQEGCEARFSDRVLACRFCLWFGKPDRGDI